MPASTNALEWTRDLWVTGDAHGRWSIIGVAVIAVVWVWAWVAPSKDGLAPKHWFWMKLFFASLAALPIVAGANGHLHPRGVTVNQIAMAVTVVLTLSLFAAVGSGVHGQ